MGATGTDGVATGTGDVATDGEDVATTGAGELGTAAELFEADGAEDSTREVIGANFSAPTMLGDVGLVNDEVTTVTSRSSRSMEGVTTEAAGWKTSDDEPAASELLEATGSFKVVANPSHQLYRASTPKIRVATHQLHAKQKVILMFDQELEHRLAECVLCRPHLVFSMRYDARLENDSEVWGPKVTALPSAPTR